MYLVGDDDDPWDAKEDQELSRSSGSGFEILTAGQASRLEDFQVLACKSRLMDAQPKMAIVNVQQNASYMRTISTETLPALMRGSRLWDLVKGKPVPPVVHWLVQRVPASWFDPGVRH